MTTTTTRRQRARKATTTAIVPRSPFTGFEDAHKLIWAANFVYSATAPVMEIDRDGFNVSLDRCRMEEQAARNEIHADHERALAAVYAGRQIRGSEPLPLDSLAGCGDAVTFTQPVTTIPVADVQGAPPFGAPDPVMDKRLAKIDAAFEEEARDSAGPAGSLLAEPDPTERDHAAGPAETPDGDEHEPALDKARVLPISSNPVPRELAPGPIRVGEWKKPGSEDGGES